MRIQARITMITVMISLYVSPEVLASIDTDIIEKKPLKKHITPSKAFIITEINVYFDFNDIKQQPPKLLYCNYI